MGANNYLQSTTILNNPGGNVNEIQYNKGGGSFGGNTNFQFNANTSQVTLRGNLNVGGWIKGKIYTNRYNFYFAGGVSGQVLTTDGTGNLNWSTLYNNYGDSNVANYLPNYSGTLHPSSINSNIGNISNLTVNGTATISTLHVTGITNLGNLGNVFVSGGTAGQYVYVTAGGNLGFTTVTGYGNSNVANYLPTHTGNLHGSNVTVTENSVANAVYANHFFSNSVSNIDTIETQNVTIGTSLTVSNVNKLKVQGGSSGQVLSTDGLGNLSWVAQTGGGGNTGNVTFNDQVVQGTGDENGGGGLYLAPGTNSTANLQYLRVRGGDYPTHIHLDTGNNNYFDQYFGADSRYVKLEANGNIVINADDDNGNSATWTFDIDGNLILPGNTFAVNYANGTQVSLGGGGVQSEIANGVSNVNIPTSGGAVEVTAGTQHWAFGTDGTLTAPNDSQIVPAGNNFNIYTNDVSGAVQFFTDVTGNNHNWSFDGYGYTQLPFSQGFTNTAVITSVGAGNIMLQAGAGPTQNFLFGSDGLLTLPGGNVTIGNQFGDQAIFSNNESFGVVSIGNAATVVQWNDDISNTSLLSAIYVNGPGGNVGDIQIRTGDISNANVWTFGNDGNFHLANGNSVIQSVSNNAGDGSGLSTLNLIPDNITGDDRYLIIDPTGPAHLHLRAGGTQDASNALLFLGGELAYTMIDDFNHEVQIKSYDSTNTASYSWTFENDGTLTIPGNLVASGASPAPTLSGFSSLGAIDSITVGTSNAVSLSSGGNIDFSQGQQIRPAGSTIIGMYSNSAGNDGVGIYTNVSSDLFNQANVNITANSATTPKTWAFDKTGNITFPDSSVQTTAWTGTAATVDITNTNGLSTVYYPTFVENRTAGQIVRADVDLSYRTDNNTLSAGNISVSGTIQAGGKIGYSSGSSVTQTTNRGQGVTINTLAGEITLVSDTIAAGDSDVLFVGCNKVDATSDIVLVQVTSYNPGTYLPIAQPTSTPFAGFQLSLTNISAFPSPTEAVTIRFMIIKAPSA